jgi:uncharacterized protein (UPF0147 family)
MSMRVASLPWHSARTRLGLLLLASLVACESAPNRASELAVRRTWDAYLAAKKGALAQRAGDPSPLWDPDEQRRWPMYDLAGFYVADGAIPEVLSVTPVNARVDTAYRIVTRFSPKDNVERASGSEPVLTLTVYAHRAGNRWLLANALPYATAGWQRATLGRITFHTAPALTFNAVRAARAVAFVDSLAAAFNVAAPPRLDYYTTESVDQALSIIGVTSARQYGAAGGFAKPVNFQVFSGIPALGEEYRHEIAHVVLLPIVRGGSTTLLASEGVPTWFGGTAGRDYQSAVRHMDSLLTARPAVTLDSVLNDMRVPSEIRNAAGAVLAAMLHEVGGTQALREYLQTPSSGMRAFLERRLARPWPAVVESWKQRVRVIAAG